MFLRCLGTRNVLVWAPSGRSKKLKKQTILEFEEQAPSTTVFGICGGFQMLGEKVDDPLNMEFSGSNEKLASFNCSFAKPSFNF